MGEVASRGTIAQGRRSPQARCSSALKGLEVPSLLDRVRFTDRNERITWFFDTWGEGHPLASPRGGIDLLMQKLICKHKGLIPDLNVKACQPI